MGAWQAQFAQLIGLGVLWVGLHCSGMCGPIMAALASTGASSGQGRWDQARRRASRVLSYQVGRAATLGVMGGAAGGLGAALEATLRQVAMASGGVVAAGLILSGVAQIPAIKSKLRLKGVGRGSWAPRLVNAALKGLAARWPAALPGRMVALGLVMGLLPCMLVFWALSLAASTAAPLAGALLMVALVVMTTPALLVAGCAPVIASARVRAFGLRMLPAAIMLSGLWLGLISAAANGWIGHAWVNFSAGRDYVIMFW